MDKKTPTSIGIIMDGNRRFAKEMGLPTLAGHKAGYDKLKEVLKWAHEAGVKYVIAYAFSTENWKRDKTEVDYLMELLRFALGSEVEEMKKEKICVQVIGETERLPKDIQEGIVSAREATKGGEVTLALAISYGGRSEIIHAINKMVQEGKVGEVTEENFKNFMWTSDIPDPDLIIRTSGEQRLSNFLSWQSAYSELFFTKTFWPAFTKEEFLGILEQFSNRERRIGK